MSNEITYLQSPLNKSRKDKFSLVFSLPASLRKIISKYERGEAYISPDTMQFSVYGAVVPSVDIPPVNVRYAGQTLAASSHSREAFAPNTVNFTIDNRFNNYWVLYSWLNLLNNDKTGVYDENELVPIIHGGDRNKLKQNPNLEYRSDISIFALDEYNKKTVEFVYTNAFPISLGGINYNYRDPGEVESSFTYSYSQFVVKPVLSL